MKKISIIGGSGFVGTNLCKLLKLSQTPFEIIDIKPSKQFPDKCKIGNIFDIDAMRKMISGEVIVNLAAVHRDDVDDLSEYHRTNVDGAKNIAQVCLEKGIKKIIFTSSVAVYGFVEGGIDENAPTNPFNEYGKTKILAEEVFREWQSFEDNSLIIVRPTVIFGEGNRGNVFNLFSQIASNKFLMVGPGHNKKSMAYIGNVVAFLDKCIKQDISYGLYNYVDTPDFSMNALVKHVRFKLKGKNNVGLRIPFWLGLFFGYIADGLSKILGRKLPLSSIRIKKFTSSTEFLSSKSELDNFDPPFSLLEGIERTLHSEFISPDPNREIFYTE